VRGRRGALHLLQRGREGRHNVKSVFSQGDKVEGTFKEPVTYPPEGEESSEPGSTPSRTSGTFTTTLPSFVDPGLEEFLIDTGVEINAEPVQEGGNSWLTLLLGFAPALLLIGFMSGSTGGRRNRAAGLRGGRSAVRCLPAVVSGLAGSKRTDASSRERRLAREGGTKIGERARR
jgi:hypothetical protein